jgi:hypothetical protein
MLPQSAALCNGLCNGSALSAQWNLGLDEGEWKANMLALIMDEKRKHALLIAASIWLLASSVPTTAGRWCLQLLPRSLRR